MKIDRDKLIKLIASSTFGTGTLSAAAEIHPDELQQLIGRGEGEETLIAKLEGMLGESLRTQETVSTATKVEATDNIPSASSQVEENKTDDVAEPQPKQQSGAEVVIDENFFAEHKVAAHDCTISKLQRMVNMRELDAQSLRDAELTRAKPRISLISWLELKLEK